MFEKDNFLVELVQHILRYPLAQDLQLQLFELVIFHVLDYKLYMRLVADEVLELLVVGLIVVE
jgi:hypothetical protein